MRDTEPSRGFGEAVRRLNALVADQLRRNRDLLTLHRRGGVRIKPSGRIVVRTQPRSALATSDPTISTPLADETPSEPACPLRSRPLVTRRLPLPAIPPDHAVLCADPCPRDRGSYTWGAMSNGRRRRPRDNYITFQPTLVRK
jgi:hypothetical protein